MIQGRSAGVTLVEVVLAVALGSIIAIGAAQLLRQGVRILGEVGVESVVTSANSRLQRTLLADMGDATFVSVPSFGSGKPVQASLCTSWAGSTADPNFQSVRPLLTMIDIVTSITGVTERSYIGYEVRANGSATEGEIWRVACGDTATGPDVPASGFQIMPRLALPNAAAWASSVKCIEQAASESALSDCPTDSRIAVLSTTVRAKVTSIVSSTAGSGSVLATRTVTVDSFLGVLEGMSVHLLGKTSGAIYVQSLEPADGSVTLAGDVAGVASSDVLILGRSFSALAFQTGGASDLLTVSDASGISAGMRVTEIGGSGIPANTLVATLDATEVTLSTSTTRELNAVRLDFSAPKALALVVASLSDSQLPVPSQTVVATRSAA